MEFKKELSVIISNKTGFDEGVIFDLLEVPKDSSHGDFALPCFMFSKKLKKSPNVVAEDLSKSLKGSWFVCSCVGPYLNFSIKTEFLAEKVLSKIKFPVVLESSMNGTIGIESPSPNSNKPLHLGHLRNMLLGLSLKNIYEKVGYDVKWFNLVNDKGVHICKSMLAYKLFGGGESPESCDVKPDHFVGKYYVKFANNVKDNPELEVDAKKMLVDWENGDKEVVALWSMMRDWWLQGVEETYRAFSISVDVQSFESDIYFEGKKIVLDGFEKGLFQKDESGAIFVDLEHKKLGKKFLLRSDGTSLYMTQDIFLAKQRFDEHKLDEFRYIVGSEQIYHFNALFEIFKILGFDFSDKCKHISYGLIALPHGRMKSREGTVVDADDFKKDMLVLVEKELKERYSDLSVDEIEKRKEIIATGAINFFILKYDSLKDFVYFPDKSLSFQGESGPYIQYSHARICSILRKKKPPLSVDFSLFNLAIEKELINKLNFYESVVLYSAKNNKPSSVAVYLLELAQLFNSFYQEVPILKEKESVCDARLFLVDKVRVVLKDGLALLGIDAPEEM